MSAVVLDTCAAIWLGNGETMRPEALVAIEEAAVADGVFVSAVTAWEIGLLSRARGKRPAIAFVPDVETWLRDLLALSGVRQTAVTMALALDASLLPGNPHNDPADRLIIATARGLRLPLVTRDAALLAYAGAGFVAAIRC
jgi:PIN domain nuclease of toxin-antitoxin system